MPKNNENMWTSRMDKAAEFYKEQAKLPGDKKLGLRAVCELMKKECWKEHKPLDKSPFPTSQGYPKPNNIQCTGKLAYRRRGDCHNQLLKWNGRARWGSDFGGVGVNWTNRFISKHKKRLRGSWSRPLDKIRAQAGNPIAKADYYQKLGNIIEGDEEDEPIESQNMYGVDETGIQEGLWRSKKEVSAPTKKWRA